MTNIDKNTLRHLYDLAMDSPLMCSGNFDSDDVATLRKVAELIGVDLDEATPDSFIRDYPHRFVPRRVDLSVRMVPVGWVDPPGAVHAVRPRTGARYTTRGETDAEYEARIAEESADRTCHAGERPDRVCGRPADDPQHI